MKRNKRRLDEVLRTQRLVSSIVLAQALAHLARYPYVEPEQVQRAALWEDAFAVLGEPWCRQVEVAPCLVEGHETFLLAYPFHLREIDRNASLEASLAAGQHEEGLDEPLLLIAGGQYPLPGCVQRVDRGLRIAQRAWSSEPRASQRRSR